MKKTAGGFLVLLLLFAAGCGDSNQVSIALTPATAQSVDEGQSFNLTATVKNDSKNKGVTWALNGGGTLSAQTLTSVTYTTPSAASSAARRLRGRATAGSTATITATSAAEVKVAASLQVTINPPPSVGTPTLTDATEGTAYSQTVSGAGGSGALTYSLASGTLPAGLSLNSSTGAITGTPTGPSGTSTFAVKVTDASNAGAMSATSGNITLKVILPAGPSISTTSLAAGTVGVAYNQTVSAGGGIAPLTYSISAGALPGGLNIGASSGAITGTPTAAGSFTFTVKVTDSSTPTAQSATQQLTIDVNAGMAITTSSLFNGTKGTSYSAQVSESGGVAPFTWSIASGSLPAGLGIDALSGAISGTPTATGVSNFTVQVVDSSTPHQTATKALSITINASTAGICDPANTGSESLLNGQYAMVLQGFDSTGAIVLGATFDADGAGHIAQNVGIEDFNTNSGLTGSFDMTIDPAQSSYTLGSDHRGCLILVNSLGFHEHFAFAAAGVTGGVATRAHVIETTVLGNVGSGTMMKQDTSAFAAAKLSGNYAFGVSDPQSNQTRFSAVGLFHLDGASAVTGQWDTSADGSLNSGGGTFPSSAITIPSGTYTVAANGRGTLAFTPTGSSQQNAILYVVNSNSFLILSSETQGAGLLFHGSATLQTGAPYSNNSMNAISVFGTSGLSTTTPHASVVRVGLITPQPPVVGSLFYIYNDAGDSNSSSNTLPSVNAQVSFPVDAAGRVVAQNASIGGLAVLYLSAPNQGYFLSMIDPLTATTDETSSTGQFWPQTGAPFNDPTFGGVNWSFGSAGADVNSATHTDGWAQFASDSPQVGDIVSGKTDTVNAFGSTLLNTAFSNRLFVTNTNGQLLFTDNALHNVSVGFQISPTSLIAIDSLSSAAPTLLFYEAQQ